MPDIFVEPHTPNQEPQNVVPQPVQDAPKINMFATFSQEPCNISFASQEHDEHIMLFLRRDFVTNFPWIFAVFILCLLPIPGSVILTAQISSFSLPHLSHGIIVVLLLFYYILVVGFGFGNFLSWFYNIGLITNKRAVDIQFFDLADVNVETAMFSAIIDAEYSQRGFAQTFFDYGEVRIRIQATDAIFVFEKIPRPSRVVSILSNLLEGGKNA